MFYDTGFNVKVCRPVTQNVLERQILQMHLELCFFPKQYLADTAQR